MFHKLAVLLVVALWAVCLSMPLDSTQDESLNDSPTDEMFKVFHRRSQLPRAGLVFDVVHDCRTNTTLKNMCTQCAQVATNGADTFLKCCANRHKVRDWCIDFINYIID